ncbi:hypothetical protein OAS21_00115 [Pelagibacteraceae bacterium]|jgi:hypothetical protein|nr:hypothetical protein [Pelagibacteraceae bacterium]
MNDNNFFKSKYLIILFIFFSQFLNAEIIIFKDCKNNVYSYDKNDYIIDLNKKMMTREFVYDEKTYQKLRMNDITVKKENITNKGIIEENGLIVSEISGYPAFYTQMIFDKKNSNIKIKTVLNNTEGESLIATCKNIINYKKES